MSLCERDDDYRTFRELTPAEEAAWRLYCDETKGSMDVRDFWDDLSPRVKAHYLNKVHNGYQRQLR